MTYSVPLTAVSNTALTAAQWNASVRDNILETAAAKFTAAGQLFVATGANAGAARTPTNQTIATVETTTSGTYVDLATVGPTVSVATGAMAIIIPYASIQNTGANNSYMSYAVSGATTTAAADGTALAAIYSANGLRPGTHLLTGLTPGTNVFTAKYRTNAGTATFSDRRLGVIPL